jgi:hypothetical protein
MPQSSLRLSVTAKSRAQNGNLTERMRRTQI